MRDEEAKQRGGTAAAPPVEIVTWENKEVEAVDLARRIENKHAEQGGEWNEFAVLYRKHSHRDELVRELAERGIPFSIVGLDVLDTAEVRDLVACLTAAVTPNDAASLFRVAALPRFAIDPQELRAAMRAVRREELDLGAVLGKLAGGSAVMQCVESAHREVEKNGIRAADAVKIAVRQFEIQRSALIDAFVKFVEAWQQKPIAETGSPSEFLDYLDYFVQAKGKIELEAIEEGGVRLVTAHSAKGLEFRHVAILRGSSTSFPTSYKEPLIAFPAELRRQKGFSQDDKTLHEEEERRLFYVAMTRAKDTLAIYAHQGRGKKDPRPTKFLREFMANPAYKKFWVTRSAEFTQDIAAGEEPGAAVPTIEPGRVAAAAAVGELRDRTERVGHRDL